MNNALTSLLHLRKPVQEVNLILSEFSPIALSEMQGVELMDRADTKFVISRSELLSILPLMIPHYQVLEIGGIRTSSYETLYYDTPDFFFYTRHHNGKMNRLKIRKRRYVESNLNFLEVKFKTNRDQTKKDRTKLPEVSNTLSDAESAFIQNETHFEQELVPKLWNFFTRVALVSPLYRERVTIDFGLSYRNVDGEQYALGNTVIVEVKQPRRNRMSPFVAELHRRHIHPEGISKYCLGVANLYSGIKKNAFKPKIRKIVSIEQSL